MRLVRRVVSVSMRAAAGCARRSPPEGIGHAAKAGAIVEWLLYGGGGAG